jgi:hypothetical protein
MSSSGVPQLIFRPLEAKDVKAISLVHHRACMIAYRFINWRYPLEQVERWYFGKFAERMRYPLSVAIASSSIARLT